MDLTGTYKGYTKLMDNTYDMNSFDIPIGIYHTEGSNNVPNHFPSSFYNATIIIGKIRTNDRFQILISYNSRSIAFRISHIEDGWSSIKWNKITTTQITV